MKKFKKYLAIVLVMTTVFVLMAIPASAAYYYGTETGGGEGYYWNSSLEIEGNTVTARITVNTNTLGSGDINPTGVVPPFLSARVDGVIYTSGDAYRAVLVGDVYEDFANSVIASDSRNISSKYEVVGARCTFTAMGKQAGNVIKLGQIFED